MGLWLTNPITKYWNTSWKPTNMDLTKYDTNQERRNFLQYNVVKGETLCRTILKRDDKK